MIGSCTECGRGVITSNPESEGYCPDCVPDKGHGKGYQNQQANDVEANENRMRTIDNSRHES